MSYKKLLFVLLLGLFIACSSEEGSDNPVLIGTWKLIEQYSDPGDGSGTYEKVDSDLEITFAEDGTFQANGMMCSMSAESTGSSQGTYDEMTGILLVDGCFFNSFNITFEINEKYLFLYYPCIEGCGQKFVKK